MAVTFLLVFLFTQVIVTFFASGATVAAGDGADS
mgnify:CR=1 FL=1